MSIRKGDIQGIHSLNRACFVSFVATARIVGISTIMPTIMFFLVVVGVMMGVYLKPAEETSNAVKVVD